MGKNRVLCTKSSSPAVIAAATFAFVHLPARRIQLESGVLEKAPEKSMVDQSRSPGDVSGNEVFRFLAIVFVLVVWLGCVFIAFGFWGPLIVLMLAMIPPAVAVVFFAYLALAAISGYLVDKIGRNDWQELQILGCIIWAILTPLNLSDIPKEGVTEMVPTNRIGAVCGSGRQTRSIDRGTCSHHGGVSRWLYLYKEREVTALEQIRRSVERNQDEWLCVFLIPVLCLIIWIPFGAAAARAAENAKTRIAQNRKGG